jgi:hypothetical protein
LLAAAIAMAALPAVAQQAATATPPAPAASMPMEMPMECGKAMKAHNHGAERGLAPAAAKTMPCMGEGAEAPAAKPAKKKPLHDHGKVHKNQ